MKLHVTFYGGLKQEVGAKTQTLELDRDSLTVHELGEMLAAEYPSLAARLPTVAFVVGDEIVEPGHALRDGDQAALLPPVSGG
jgi:molybdopterin converting factor small subunit